MIDECRLLIFEVKNIFLRKPKIIDHQFSGGDKAEMLLLMPWRERVVAVLARTPPAACPVCGCLAAATNFCWENSNTNSCAVKQALCCRNLVATIQLEWNGFQGIVVWSVTGYHPNPIRGGGSATPCCWIRIWKRMTRFAVRSGSITMVS